jgi:hypothetical protein
LAVRPSPDQEGAFDLLFNIGAMGNDFGGGAVQLGGLLDARLLDSALYMTTVTDSGVDVSMTDPVQIATGLRNAAAFGFDPDTGNLWITDNGIDGLDNPLHAFSADELDLIPRSQIGGDPEDFGFPDSYVLYDTGEVVGDATGLQFAFVPTDGSENEGISSMAFAPSKFPSGFNHGIFAGFHGQFDSAGIENEENPLLYYDLDSGQIRTIVPNDAPNVGHLNSLLPTDDALFVADFCTNGSLSSAEPCGTLYKVTPA